MNPVYLRRDDLHLGFTLSALSAGPDGRRLYVGRGRSDDQARENLAILDVEPDSGTVLRRRLFRDSDAPLPPSFTVPIARRPGATVTAALVAPRYRKLYLAADLEDPAARPRRLLSVYDLDDAGDPVESSLRTYRADVDGFAGEVQVEQLALNPVADVLYMTGGKWIALRWHRLDASGEPVADQPSVLPIAGNSALTSPRLNTDGTRLYLGRSPRTLTVLRVVDGAPVLEPGPPPKPLLTLASAVPELALGGEGYLRMIHTPRALLAMRSLLTLTGPDRARPVPLYALPLDEHGDVPPGVTDWQRVDGFDHVVLAHDAANDRLWLARETTTLPPAAAGLPDGFQLAAYELGPDGLPGAEVERHPTRWGDQPVLATVGGTGQPAVLSRPWAVPDLVAGEQVRFRVRRVAPPPTGQLTFACTFFGAYDVLHENFSVAEGALSAPVSLDPYLTKQHDQVPVRLRFTAALVPGAEYTVEAHYTPAGAAAPLVRTTTVRGRDAMFLLPGYRVVPPEGRPERFESFADHWQVFRKTAEAVAVAEDERPDQFVMSAFGVYGGQGHAGQLEDGLAAVRTLGLNSTQLPRWEGIPAGELAEAAHGLSPDASLSGVPLGVPFAFAFDGSLTEVASGKVVDAGWLRAWAEKFAAAVRAASGLSPARVVRLQLADEPGWYFPGVLALTDPDEPQVPVTSPALRWTDPEQRNATWMRRFQDYVAERDPELVTELGAGLPGTVPIGASAATTPALRRLYYWSTRFFVDEATAGVSRMHDELQTAFKADHLPPDPRPEHARLHVQLNFGEQLDWQWHKPYPNAVGDKNPDSGPDAATGSYDWFRLGAASPVLPSKHTYLHDAGSQVWSGYADLLRSATVGGGEEFTAFLAGSSLGNLPAGAAYKLGALVSRGAKMVTAYAFGPETLFVPPNGWAGNLDAYAPLADAMRLVGRAQPVLYPGVPEPGRVAIHFPAGSRLWDQHPGATCSTRELQALHTALVHDGYAVDFVDDAGLAAGVLAERGYSVLHLLGPNLPRPAQRAVAAWVRDGGTVVVLPGAAARDEADAPYPVVTDLLGVTGLADWEPVRREAHLGTTFGLSHRLTVIHPNWLAALDTDQLLLRDIVTDPRTPGFIRQDFPRLELAGAQVVATLAPLSAPDEPRPAITRRAVGRGVAYAYAFFPGWQYWCTATHPMSVKGLVDLHLDRLPRHWNSQDRLLAALPTRLADTPRSVRVDRAAVEARRLQSDHGIAVVLLNWTGAPIESLTVTVDRVGRFQQVSSARSGPLTNFSAVPTQAAVRLPLADVDILVLE